MPKPNPRTSLLSRRLLLRGSGTWLLLEAGRAVLLTTACDPVSTGGQRVTIATKVETDLDQGPVVNAKGWEVTVETLQLSVQHLQYVTGEPVGQASLGPTNFAQPKPWFQSLPNLLGERIAHAHPGHYDAGTTLGEMAKAQVIDTTALPKQLDKREGVTGTAHSGIVTLGGDANGVTASLTGRASKAGRTVHFELQTSLDDVHGLEPKSDVSGCPFTHGEITTDGTVTFTIHSRIWVEQVDFDAHTGPAPSSAGAATGHDATPNPLTDASPNVASVSRADAGLFEEAGATATTTPGSNTSSSDAGGADTAGETVTHIGVSPGSPAHNAFVRGLLKAVAFEFSYRS